MPSLPSNLQVIVVADDPIEAGMLALDLVQAGAPAHAVRDAEAAAQQVSEARATPNTASVVVAAYRDLHQAISLWAALSASPPAVAFVAIVLRSQRDAAAKYMEEAGWAGIAVRPVTAEDLVALVRSAAGRVSSGFKSARDGDLAKENLLELLGGLVDRVPRTGGGGKTALVRLWSEEREGIVALVSGELVHAEVEGTSGRHALERMATWRRGRFEVTTEAWAGPSTLSGAPLALIAIAHEYTRRVDEARLSLPYNDCVCTVRWERVRPLPVVAEALFRRIATGQVLSEAIAGEGDDELEAFAALEARIKRGAVVPQVETAPKTYTSIEAGGTGSIMNSGRRPGATPDYPSGSLSMVDAQQLPERHRAHPATNLYRLGEDGQPVATPGGDDVAPPRLSATAAPAPQEVSVEARTTNRILRLQDDQVGPARRLPTPVEIPDARPRPQSSLLATAGGRSGRVGPVTGWFGVATSDSGVTEAEEPLLENRRAKSSVRIVDRGGTDVDRLVSGSAAANRISPSGTDQRVAARPYAWIPAAQLEEEIPEPPPPKVMALLKPKNWPWAIAAVAALAVVIWVVAPRTSGVPAVDPLTRRYNTAIDLIDNGHADRARRELLEVSKNPASPPEALLQLGVLEVEANQLELAKPRLEAYIANPGAKQADKARRLYQHVYGAAPDTVRPGGPTP